MDHLRRRGAGHRRHLAWRILTFNPAIDSFNPMFTIIGGDGQEYGPVSLQQLRSWLTEGRVNLDTQAKAVGSTEWQRLGDLPEFGAGSTSAVPPPLSTASPALVTGPVDSASFANDLISRADKLDVFSCLDRSFQLWKTNFLPLVGVTLLVLLTQMVLNAIPIIGSFAGLLLNGVFYGGLYYYYLGKMRGEPRTVGDAYAGFKRGLGSLVGATVLTTCLTLLVIVSFIGPALWPVLRETLAGEAGAMEMPTLSLFSGVAVFLGFLIVMYLSVSWVFSFALIVDQGLGAWSAMEVSRRVISKQWFRVFFVLLLGGIVALLGLIGIVVGVILTLPLGFGAILYAYEDLCNPPTAAVGTSTGPLTA